MSEPNSIPDVVPNNVPDLDNCKLQYHVDKLHQIIYGEPKRVSPIYVELSPVGYCNQDCIFCGLDFKRERTKGKFIDLDVLVPLFREMAQCGVRSIMLGGEGEPTLHPNIGHIVQATKEAGLAVGITTNGVRLDRILSWQDSIDWIKVSVDAGDKETYCKIHRCPMEHWDMMWENVRKAAVHDKCVVGIQAIVLPENVYTLHNLITKASQVGARYVVLKPYSQHTMSIVRRSVDYGDMSSVLKGLVNIGKACAIPVIVRENAITDMEDKHKYGICMSVPYLWAYVDSEGKVSACSCWLDDNRFTLGNVYEKNFKEIWWSKRRYELIEYMVKGMDISTCRHSCRMNECNKYLWKLVMDKPLHWEFV
jgi:cyclic pyranopterin phosphate synthase